MDLNLQTLKDWQAGARRALNDELERLKEKCAELNDYRRSLDATDQLIRELDNLNGECDRLRKEAAEMESDCNNAYQELAEERARCKMLETRLEELKTVAAGVVVNVSGNYTNVQGNGTVAFNGKD